MSLHGQSKDALAKTKLGAWEYDVVAPLYKCNMTDIMAAIGLVQLRRYPELLARRYDMVRRYDAGLPQEVLRPAHLRPDMTSDCHLYLARLPGRTHEQRSAVITKMAERGVACNVHYKPLPLLTAYKIWASAWRITPTPTPSLKMRSPCPCTRCSPMKTSTTCARA